MPERRISFDPDQIVTIEILAKAKRDALVRIVLKKRKDPVEIKFRDKKEAIEFIYALWGKRKPHDQ